MSKKKALPYMPFYFGDWRKAPEVRALDLDVRMIWFELLGYMWDSNERGYLTLNGNPVSTSVITKLIGVDISVIEKSIAQMELYGTFSRRVDGAIYCRRMVKDEETRQNKSQAGKAGMEARYSKEAKKAKSKITEPVTPVITEPVTPVITEPVTPVITEPATPVITPFDNDNDNSIVSNLSNNNTDDSNIPRDFQKKGTTGKFGNQIDDVDDYTDYSLYASPEVCKYHYLNKPIGAKPLEEACLAIYNYTKSAEPKELKDRVSLWLDEFNKYLNNSFPGGRMMNGTDSYQSFFINWLRKRGSKLKFIPMETSTESTVQDTQKKIYRMPTFIVPE